MNNKFYESFGHAKTRLRYHIIFSTKYRRNCLSMIRDIVLNAFRQAEMNSKISILEMEIDKDHIHFDDNNSLEEGSSELIIEKV